ncbi:helix-turn-helix domain-containing protein [Rhizobium mesosinicum]|jgi:transcriptional regulator with XRE-family HTH domain|uniref:Helix-turn-helix transcriptional regulator n=1 Tax=Rhizobium mesosinicum TaxID=335017 RepID=A0ABS7GRR7_9HYPH|nr:helix-turn-helix transcriptional regulator [Rhizobium mesosinicum]MBW9052620.1 helix-turn-helix transcriptional regulator [Rhizobium mesosinicum]
MKAKSPTSIDAYVGSRVRARRKVLRLSQVGLAERIGVTFQQIQKYEKGTNRIGAGRLQSIAETLGVPVQFFFENDTEPTTYSLVSNGRDDVNAFLASKDAQALNRAFMAIESPAIRQKLVALAKSLARDTHPEIDDIIHPETGA